MITTDIQSQFNSYTPYQYGTSSLDQTSLVRSYESIFQEDIIKTNFYAYYRRKLDKLVEHFQKNDVSLTNKQEDPLKNILDLL